MRMRISAHAISRRGARRCCTSHAGAEPAVPADHAGCVVEAGRWRKPELAYPRPARDDHRTAVFHSVEHQPAIAGMVCTPVPPRDSLPAVCLVQSGISAGAARVPGNARALDFDGHAIDIVVGALRFVRVALLLRRDRERAQRSRRRRNGAQVGGCGGCRTGAGDRQAADVDAAGGYCNFPVVVGDQSHLPEHRLAAVPVDTAVVALPGVVHPVSTIPGGTAAIFFCCWSRSLCR